MKEVLIYGGGDNCDALLECGDLRDVRILGIIDRDKAGQTLRGVKMYAPDDIRSFRYDEILITLMDNDAVVEMLIDKYDVDRDRIILPGTINSQYVLPRMRERKNVVLVLGGSYKCYAFAFSKLVHSGDFIVLRLLSCEERHEIEGIYPEEKLIVFISAHVSKHRRNHTFQSIKAAYPNSTKFLWMCDPCEAEEYGGPALIREYGGIDNLKKDFDICYTYHHGDAEKYGLTYYPQFFPDVRDRMEYKSEPEYDLFFIGALKKRKELIYSVYQKASAAGVRCRFLLLYDKEEEKIDEEGIYYLERPLSYEESLEELLKCRCILEICDPGDETSFRYSEAVTFGRKLLLNDETVKQRPYYSVDNIQVFDDADNIDAEWLCSPIPDINYMGDLDTERVFSKEFGVLKR
ncbi:MAG: hypothetical protein IJS24_08290 [Eubacterium sp.]|nr:hypothetical protein [Eubacterium sp.]